MSALAGIFHCSGQPVDPACLDAMLTALEHRTPDGAKTWHDGEIGLAAGLLITVPEHETGDSGLVRDGEGYVIVADARIDNRAELIRALGLQTADAAEWPDERLMLAAYRHWGCDCAQRLEGDFAFAVWDPRLRQLFCARDAMGIRPFYYCRNGSSFMFASEIKALLALPDFRPRLNERRIAGYLATFFADREATFYEGIQRLPPGALLVATAEQFRIELFWDVTQVGDVRFARDEEYIAAFRDILSEAVRCRLRARQTPGILLSGGLDSNSVLALARRHAGGEVARNKCYSAIFPDFPEIDEREPIKCGLDAASVPYHWLRADRISPLGDWAEMFRAMDEPFHTPNLFIQWELAREASGQGEHVLIDGLDGDSVVAHGLEYLYELFCGFHWRRLRWELRQCGRRFRQPARRFFYHYCALPFLVRHFPGATRRRARRCPSGRGSLLLRSEFARRINFADIARQHQPYEFPAGSLREDHQRTLGYGMIPFYMEVNDKAAAVFAIEQRHPFYDRRLVEFCLGLPSDLRLRNGWDRYIQREALKDDLPPPIRQRIFKSNWARNFERQLIKVDQPLLDDIIVAASEPIAEFVNIDHLRQAYRRCRQGRFHESDMMNVWVSVTLGLWLRMLESRHPARSAPHELLAYG